MAEITGPRSTVNVDASIRKIDMKAAILELDGNAAPLTHLTSALSSTPATNPEFSWMEDDRAPRFDAVNGTTGTGTTIVVDNIDRFAEHALWKVTRTGEVVRVVSVNAGSSTATVVRGVGGSAVAVADNDELLHIGWAQPEGDTSRPARSANPTKVTNYTQINRTPVDATRTWRDSANYTTPRDWDRQLMKAGLEHKIDWEETFFHGHPSEVISGSTVRRTTGGVFHYVQTNRTDAGGTLTEAEFFGAFSAAFRHGNQATKTLFASRLVLDVINGFPRGKLESVQSDNDTTYGLNVRRFQSPLGVLNVIPHNLLEGAVYGGYGVVLDMGQIERRPFTNADTHMRENIGAPDYDGQKNEILTEQGLEFGLEKAHAIISGVTG